MVGRRERAHFVPAAGAGAAVGAESGGIRDFGHGAGDVGDAGDVDNPLRTWVEGLCGLH